MVFVTCFILNSYVIWLIWMARVEVVNLVKLGLVMGKIDVSRCFWFFEIDVSRYFALGG